MKTFLHNQANVLRQIATSMALRQHKARLLDASYQLQRAELDCGLLADAMDEAAPIAGVALLFGAEANSIADGAIITAGVFAGICYSEDAEVKHEDVPKALAVFSLVMASLLAYRATVAHHDRVWIAVAGFGLYGIVTLVRILRSNRSHPA